MRNERVAIVGGGFSGTMAAVNLARFGGPVATVIERCGMFGPGVAFGGRDRGQLLNVKASNMSAYPYDPGHFRRWLEANHLEAEGFARRADYGRYLAEEIEAVSARHPGRIERIASTATRATRTRDGWQVACANGASVAAETLVLASGLAPPATPPGIDPSKLPAGRWVADPWRDDPPLRPEPGKPVLLIGTGLTMVDVALAYASDPDGPPLHALSRRGLIPRAHAPVPASAGLDETPRSTIGGLLATTRSAAREIGWRGAIDRLRPHTQAIWQRLAANDRARFMRHLRPFWDVHRHRLAPELADRIEGMIACGRLTIHAGRLETAEPTARGVNVSWQPRGSAARVAMDFSRVVNCTGPAPIERRSDERLIAHLIATGAARTDAFGLGLDVDQRSRVLKRDGAPDGSLYALGALTRGKFWEISAVPDIRVQAWDVARRLSNAHWVEGEGL